MLTSNLCEVQETGCGLGGGNLSAGQGLFSAEPADHLVEVLCCPDLDALDHRSLSCTGGWKDDSVRKCVLAGAKIPDPDAPVQGVGCCTVS